MAKYEFNLPKEYEVSVQRGTAKVVVNVENLTDEILGKLVLHGLRQKIADAAAGAKKAAEAEDETRTSEEIAADLMEKVRRNLESGEWGAERGGGATADPLDKYRLEIMREIMRGNDALKARYDEIPSDDQKARRELLLAIAAKNAEKIDPEAERRKQLADEKRRAARGLDLDM